MDAPPDPSVAAASLPDAAADAAARSAIRRHEERLARDPTSLVFAQLAELYRKAGRTEDAVTLCREGLARYPHYTTARLTLARALADAGQPETALDEVRAIIDLSPKDVQCHRFAAELLRKQGDIAGAVAHLETAVALDPGDRESRALLALLAPPPVGEEATGVARLLTDDTFVTIPFGTLCLEQGLVDEAAHVFTRLLRKDPHNAEARAGLEQTLRARSRRKG
jgi:tetratricopeptide (TPR) repeat protein